MFWWSFKTSKDAAKYFDSPKAFDGATLRPCNETRLMITSAMKFYAELTGDWDGVEIVGEASCGGVRHLASSQGPQCTALPQKELPIIRI